MLQNDDSQLLILGRIEAELKNHSIILAEVRNELEPLKRAKTQMYTIASFLSVGILVMYMAAANYFTTSVQSKIDNAIIPLQKQIIQLQYEVEDLQKDITHVK
jgi:archaellum component FlaC